MITLIIVTSANKILSIKICVFVYMYVIHITPALFSNPLYKRPRSQISTI